MCLVVSLFWLVVACGVTMITVLILCFLFVETGD